MLFAPAASAEAQRTEWYRNAQSGSFIQWDGLPRALLVAAGKQERASPVLHLTTVESGGSVPLSQEFNF